MPVILADPDDTNVGGPVMPVGGSACDVKLNSFPYIVAEAVVA